MKDFLIWDSSTPYAFFSNNCKGEMLQFFKKFEKRGLGTDFPVFFSAFENNISVTPDSVVYIGAGPGSFTGVKTGNSIIVSYLYSKGVENVNLMSSLDILSLFMPYYEDSLYFMVSPFNVKDYFISIFKWDHGKRFYLERDSFKNYANLELLIKRFNYDSIILFSVERLPEHILDLFKANFRNIMFFSPQGDYHYGLIEMIPVLKQVNIKKDPLILNYVTNPADLKGEHSDFYLSLN